MIKKYDDKIDSFLDPQKSFDNFMKALPSADEFASLTKFSQQKPDAQVEAMKAAYSVAIKGVEYIGNAIVNVANMEERRKLQEKLDKMLEDYYKYKGQYEKVIYEYNLVKNLVVVLEGMRFFADAGNHFKEQLKEPIQKLTEYLNSKNIASYYSEVLNVQHILEEFW